MRKIIMFLVLFGFFTLYLKDVPLTFSPREIKIVSFIIGEGVIKAYTKNDGKLIIIPLSNILFMKED